MPMCRKAATQLIIVDNFVRLDFYQQIKIPMKTYKSREIDKTKVLVDTLRTLQKKLQMKIFIFEF